MTAQTTQTAEPASRPAPAHRLDIQAMRALAVVLVIVSHAWPAFAPGGFIGVDVFFVVSGFLITGLLAAELERDGRINLPRFFARRVGRLLPLSAFTVLVTGLVSWLWLSPLLWPTVARHMMASGLYVQNWALIADSADYAALDEGASPLQHFWSLAVEEQYYLIFPLTLLVCWFLARRRGVIIAVAVATGVSLGFALGWEPMEPSWSYFNTATRVWEFGAGALLALWGLRLRHVAIRLAAQVIGVGTLVAAAFVIPDSLSTPGPSTIVVAVASLLVLAANDPGVGVPATPMDQLIRLRPVQYVGDISYGLYLWHWPALMVAQELMGPDQPWAPPAGIVVSFALAVATYPLENTIRRWVGKRATSPGRAIRVIVTGVLSASLLALAGGWALGRAGAVDVEPSEPLPSVPLSLPPVSSSDDPSAPASEDPALACHGAAAMQEGADCPDTDEVTPDPRTARRDMPHEECKESLTGSEVRTCDFGSGSVKVALVGDSHAQRLIAALEPIAAARDWTITTYLKSSCPFTAVPPIKYEQSCAAWNGKVQQELIDVGYDIVIVNSAAGLQYRVEGGESHVQAGARGMQQHWSELTAGGATVLAVKDNPQPGFARMDPPACVIAKGPHECLADAGAALLDDSAELAAEESTDDHVHLIDLTEFYCRDDQCPAVIGGVLVYRDGQHLHSAYTASLAPFINRELEDILR